MKKIQLLSLALVASLSMSAENTTTLRVWIGGEKTEYELSMVDSLTFCTNTDDEPEDPEAPLAGVFSVSADKQVKFSKGNLQYTQSTDTWAFASQQYEYLGTDNVDNGVLADKIDLFGWSGNTGSAKWGISISKDANNYAGYFVDWGQNIKDGTSWRTLTKDEWVYLFQTRANADTKYGVARINLSGSAYVNGLIILPDVWVCPDGITFKSGVSPVYIDGANKFGIFQTFSQEQWLQLEAAGAIFLPASGLRCSYTGYNDAVITGVQDFCYYWSATPFQLDGAYILYFNHCNLAPQAYNSRYDGRSVRLVQDL